MAQFNCDICGVRPATVRVAVLQDGRRRYLDVCDYHYAQLTRHQRTLSPLEALFRAAQTDPSADASAGTGAGQAMEAGDGAVVESYISYLRKKGDAPYDVPLIRTVRGVGYSLRAPQGAA